VKVQPASFLTKLKECVKTPSTTKLYRAVGVEEYYSIMRTRKFSIGRGVDVKYFGLDFGETLKFANTPIGRTSVAVFEVIVNKSIMEKIADFTVVDLFIFRKGTVIIYEENLDLFNSAIISIVHKL